MHPLSRSKKIMIIGNCGTGKSTLARQLSLILKLPIIHLDKLKFKPNWEEIDNDSFNLKVAKEMSSMSEWIIDGNYSSSFENRSKAADTIILLKIPLILSYIRILKRRFMYHNKVRPDVAEGCRENLNWEMIRWIWNYIKRAAGKTADLLEKNKNNKNIIVLDSSKKVKKFLGSIVV
ncbi:DNA topology modulation protein [soil metagenome]